MEEISRSVSPSFKSVPKFQGKKQEKDSLENWRISTPARIELVGPSQGGKSTLVLKLLQDDGVWDSAFRKVIYAAPTLEDREEYLESLKTACEETQKTLLALDKIPELGEILDFGQNAPVLLILDDLLGFRDAQSVKDMVTLHSHHRKISCLFCVQNPFLKSSKLDLTTLSRNLTGRFILYQLNDWIVYRMIHSRLFPEKKNFLLRCLETSRNKYDLNYVFINTSIYEGVPRRYMVYTALLERDRYGGSPLFFDLEG